MMNVSSSQAELRDDIFAVKQFVCAEFLSRAGVVNASAGHFDHNATSAVGTLGKAMRDALMWSTLYYCSDEPPKSWPVLQGCGANGVCQVSIVFFFFEFWFYKTSTFWKINFEIQNLNLKWNSKFEIQNFILKTKLNWNSKNKKLCN